MKKTRSLRTALLVLLLLLIPYSLLDADEGDQREYRTTDKYLLELLEARQKLGPEIIKSGHHENTTGSRALLAFWLSQPTSNMFDYDVEYYNIDIELFFSQHSIESSAQIGIEALTDDMNFIDLTFCQDLAINAVMVDGQAATYIHNAELFTIYLPEPIDSGEHISIRVGYHGLPVFYGTGSGLSFNTQHTSQICQTECEPYGSRNWFPCKDFPYDKADSVDLRITHPSGMTTCANGLLQSISDNGDDTKTTHWRTNYPITTYVIHFVTAYQNLWEQEWEYAPGDTMPVVVYAYDGFPQAVNNYLTYTIPGLDVYSEIFGLYPFALEKYGHSIYDEWGMENQTMTALYHTLANEWTIVHEMAHHW